MTTKPRQLYGYWVNQIRLPGGILFVDLCARELATPRWTKPLVSELLRRVLMFAIDVMVKLKSPDVIALLAHEPCGAGNALGLSPTEVNARHRHWQQLLKERYPHIDVRCFCEPHSDCGHHREPHRELPLKDAA
jgi:hypothetical protein